MVSQIIQIIKDTYNGLLKNSSRNLLQVGTPTVFPARSNRLNLMIQVIYFTIKFNSEAFDKMMTKKKKDVVRHNKERCSYRCQYYQDGAVLSLCNKYKKQLRYDGKIPPLLTDECKAELVGIATISECVG